MKAVESPVFPDEEVVSRVKAGETALFEVLMRRYNQRLFRVARSILRDDTEAEDVMQQAYLNAYAHLDQFAGRASFATWLTRIAVHEASARVRRRRSVEGETMRDPEEDVTASLADRGPGPEEQLLAGEVRLLLESAIDALPVHYRCTFVLREVEGLATAEAAESLGISEELVKTRLHRARAILRDELCRRAGDQIGRAFSFHLSRCDRVVSGVMALVSTGSRSRAPTEPAAKCEDGHDLK
jgi:RNA polymerase sigma-70 factor, ECF subfamily